MTKLPSSRSLPSLCNWPESKTFWDTKKLWHIFCPRGRGKADGRIHLYGAQSTSRAGTALQIPAAICSILACSLLHWWTRPSLAYNTSYTYYTLIFNRYTHRNLYKIWKSCAFINFKFHKWVLLKKCREDEMLPNVENCSITAVLIVFTSKRANRCSISYL